MEKNRSVNKIKKRRRLIALFIIILIAFLIIFNFIRKKDYKINYQRNDYNIEETYNKEKNYYAFIISKNDVKYFTILSDKHFFTKKLIYDINEFNTDNESCIAINSNKAKFEPLCLNADGQISYHLVSEKMKEKINYNQEEFGQKINETYFNISVNNTIYKNFYIWNYHGFYRINKDTAEEISIFNKDIYSPSLTVQVDKYLFVPDYEADYYFNKAYIIDMTTSKLSSWNLDESIYFDSAVLGVYNDEFYLVDKHEKKEWKINISKRLIEQVGSESKGGITYQNGFIDVTMNKLLYQDNTFTGVLPINYVVENGLYLQFQDNKMKLINENPTSIIKYDEESIYYLKNDSLYAYFLDYGEIFLMNYFEWNFNNTNMIFIY